MCRAAEIKRNERSTNLVRSSVLQPPAEQQRSTSHKVITGKFNNREKENVFKITAKGKLENISAFKHRINAHDRGPKVRKLEKSNDSEILQTPEIIKENPSESSL